MTLSVGGFGGDCITTGGFGCEVIAVEHRLIREVLRPNSQIDQIMKLNSPLGK